MNRFESILDFKITTMGTRVLVFILVAWVCVLNTAIIAAWPAVAPVSRFMSGPLAKAQVQTGLGIRTRDAFQSQSREFELKGSEIQRSTQTDWSELILTIQWPTAFCTDYNDTHNDTCVVPDSIKDWTIHGLWPSIPGKEGPAFCNNTWQFNPKNIKDLESAMNQSWPDFITKTPFYDLWSHEWDKHGTCASSLPALYGEHNYFQKTLDLYKQFNVFSILEQGGVTPTMEMSYTYGKILEAVTKSVGKKTTITCLYDKKTRLVYLSEIEFCMDKQFNITDCTPLKRESRGARGLQDEDCYHQQRIFYPPMNGL